MRKRITGIILAASIFFAMAPQTVMAAKMETKPLQLQETAEQSGTEAVGGISDMEGDGSETAPYRIESARQLRAFADLVNGVDGMPDTGICASLTCNLDLSGVCGPELGSWTPIGTKDHPYTGTFDGGSFTITGLYFYEPGTSYTGLFGRNAGTIKNLGVVGADITAGNYTGGVCGYNSGIISGCRHAATVKGANYTGGICGYNDGGGSISVCYNTGEVSGRKYAGAICGYNKNILTDCFNMGPVTGEKTSIGGICGYNKVSVSNCYNAGSVAGGGKKYIGSICGYNHSKSTFLNCYYLITGEEKGNYGVAASKECFASGEVCWFLNGGKSENVIWHQTCGVGFPTFIGKTVYQVQQHKTGGRADEMIAAYTNEKEKRQAAADNVSAGEDTAEQNSGDAAHEHRYQEPEWEWTKYEAAKAVFTCEDCAEKLTLEARISKSIRKATCAKEGATVYTASVDRDGKNYTDQKSVKSEKLPHQPLVYVAQKDETCEETGIKECWTCPACGKYFTDEQGSEELPRKQVVIPARGHHYVRSGEWVWNIDSNPDSNPVKASLNFVCDNPGCGETKIQEAKVTVETTATCTEEGDTVYTATLRLNNETYTDEKRVPGRKLPHSYGKPKWDWAEDYKSASAVFTCSSCKQSASRETTDIEETITSGSDCKTPGKITYTASVEFEGTIYIGKKTEKTPPEHKLTIHAAAKEATCEEEGNQEYWQCSVCQKYFADAQGAAEIPKKQVVIPARGHHYVRSGEWVWNIDSDPDSNPVKASLNFVCDNPGCGKTETMDAVISVETSASCTTAGETTYTAVVEVNNKSYEDYRIVTGKPIPHSYGEPEWTWADDNTSAVAEFACEKCNHTETKTDTNPTSERVKEPTCLVAGEIAYTARVSFEGEEYTDVKADTIPKTAHSYTKDPVWTWAKDFSTATARFTCDICNTSTDEKADVTQAAIPGKDCGTPGKMTYTATVTFQGKPYTCPEIKEKVIPAAHTLTRVAAEAAKCEREGNGEYWQCSVCHKLFADAKGTKEISQKPVIPAAGHKLEHVEDNKYKCTVCGSLCIVSVAPDGTTSIFPVEGENAVMEEAPAQSDEEEEQTDAAPQSAQEQESEDEAAPVGKEPSPGLEEKREEDADQPASEQVEEEKQSGEGGQNEQDEPVGEGGQNEQGEPVGEDAQNGQDEPVGEDAQNGLEESCDDLGDAPENAARYGLIYPGHEEEDVDSTTADVWEGNAVNLRAESAENAATQTVRERQGSSLGGAAAVLAALAGFVIILLYKGKRVM